MIYIYIVAVLLTALIAFGTYYHPGNPHDLYTGTNYVAGLIYIDFILWFWAQANLLIAIIIAVILSTILRLFFKFNQQRYFIKIKPSETIAFQRITLSGNRIPELGVDQDHTVHFIAKNDAHQVFFPESTKPTAKYYLTDVTFTPHFETTEKISGKTGAALAGALIAGPIGVLIGASGSRKVTSTTKKLISTAYLALLTADCQTAISLQIKCKSSDYGNLLTNFKMNRVQLMNLMDHLKA